MLFDFGRDFDTRSIQCSDSKVALVKSEVNSALRMETGHGQPWPGITMPAPRGHWDLSDYAAVLVRLNNTGTNRVTVCCRVDNPGADGTKHCVTDSMTLKPGQTNTLIVRLVREADSTLDGKLFGMRGYPKAAAGPDALDVTNVTQLLLFVDHPTESHSFQVMDIRAGGEHTRPTAWVSDADPFFPFIDTFGQYKHKDWPGKVRSLAELQQRRVEAEARNSPRTPGPHDWDKYGGWASGPQLEGDWILPRRKDRRQVVAGGPGRTFILVAWH